MSGIDAITTIRAQFPKAQIIVLRIYPGDVWTRAPQVGMHSYVLKGRCGESCWRRFPWCMPKKSGYRRSLRRSPKIADPQYEIDVVGFIAAGVRTAPKCARNPVLGSLGRVTRFRRLRDC